MIICAGGWSRTLAATAGVRLPIKVNKHSYILTDIVDELRDKILPNTRVFDDATYFKVSLLCRQTEGAIDFTSISEEGLMTTP